MKQFMVIETFFAGCREEAYRRFHAQGRMLPDGLEQVPIRLTHSDGVIL